MLEFPRGIPQEFCWHSRGKHLESQRDFDGIPLEYQQNTATDFVQNYCIFSKNISMKYLSFLRKEPEFLWYFLEFGWYYDGILEVFWWISSQKSIGKGLTEFNRYFGGIFYVFSHPATPQKSLEKALYWWNLTGILMEFSLHWHCWK